MVRSNPMDTFICDQVKPYKLEPIIENEITDVSGLTNDQTFCAKGRIENRMIKTMDQLRKGNKSICSDKAAKDHRVKKRRPKHSKVEIRSFRNFTISGTTLTPKPLAQRIS